MKLTTDQQDYLRAQLQRNLNYRETYLEFYDHIITALENKPQHMDFQDAVDSIVNEDFGGYNGMLGIEMKYKREITGEIKNRYKIYMMEFLKTSLLGITILISGLFYWMTRQPWFCYWIFIAIVFGMRVLPGLIRGTREIVSGYIFTRPKSSVKDSVFKWLDYLPIVVLIILAATTVFNNPSPQIWYSKASVGCLTVILSAYALHTIACFRIYKDEFKTTLISQ